MNLRYVFTWKVTQDVLESYLANFLSRSRKAFKKTSISMKWMVIKDVFPLFRLSSSHSKNHSNRLQKYPKKSISLNEHTEYKWSDLVAWLFLTKAYISIVSYHWNCFIYFYAFFLFQHPRCATLIDFLSFIFLIRFYFLAAEASFELSIIYQKRRI